MNPLHPHRCSPPGTGRARPTDPYDRVGFMRAHRPGPVSPALLAQVVAPVVRHLEAEEA